MKISWQNNYLAMTVSYFVDKCSKEAKGDFQIHKHDKNVFIEKYDNIM